MLRAEQTQRQIHDVLLLRLTRDRPTQQLSNFFLERATVRCSMLLKACVQNRVNIEINRLGMVGFLNLLAFASKRPG